MYSRNTKREDGKAVLPLLAVTGSRYTVKSSSSKKSYYITGDAVEVFARFEDIGMSPEEIVNLLQKQQKAIEQLNRRIDRMIEHIRSRREGGW